MIANNKEIFYYNVEVLRFFKQLTSLNKYFQFLYLELDSLSRNCNFKFELSTPEIVEQLATNPIFCSILRTPIKNDQIVEIYPFSDLIHIQPYLLKDIYQLCLNFYQKFKQFFKSDFADKELMSLYQLETYIAIFGKTQIFNEIGNDYMFSCKFTDYNNEIFNYLSLEKKTSNINNANQNESSEDYVPNNYKQFCYIIQKVKGSTFGFILDIGGRKKFVKVLSCDSDKWKAEVDKLVKAGNINTIISPNETTDYFSRHIQTHNQTTFSLLNQNQNNPLIIKPQQANRSGSKTSSSGYQMSPQLRSAPNPSNVKKLVVIKDKQSDQQIVDFYYINPLIELLGYFILNFFGLSPNVIPFQSQITKKFFIIVDELDSAKYKFCDECCLGSSLDDDSVILYHQLRVIHFLFRIDDFHQKNVAISGKIRPNNSIQHIDGIQVVDLWPTRRPLTFQKLTFIPNSCKSIKSFEDNLYIKYFDRYKNNQNKQKIILSCKAFGNLMLKIEEFKNRFVPQSKELKEANQQNENNNSLNFHFITILVIKKLINNLCEPIKEFYFDNKTTIINKYIGDISLNIKQFYQSCSKEFILYSDLYGIIYGDFNSNKENDILLGPSFKQSDSDQILPIQEIITRLAENPSNISFVIVELDTLARLSYNRRSECFFDEFQEKRPQEKGYYLRFSEIIKYDQFLAILATLNFQCLKDYWPQDTYSGFLGRAYTRETKK